MPLDGHDVAVQLFIDRTPHRETWTRWFAGRRVVTDQYERCGRLIERFGRLELEFHVEVSARCLTFNSANTRIRLGPVRVPLTRSVGPRVEAVTAATEYEGQVWTRVQVCLPLVGVVLSYQGRLELTP